MKYKCDDVFMIRAPTLPIDSYLELFEFNDIKDNISKFISDEDNYNFLNEGLIVASKSLHKSFNSDMKSKKKEKSYNLSLLKYIIRASTRPTPYGLFAGVALGKFSDLEMEDNIVIDKNKCIRDVKVDTYWICHLIHELEKDHNILSKLSLQFNTICYKYGDRFKNPYFANHGGIDNLKDYVQENNIKHSPLIDIIKENSRSFIPYEDLKYRICEIYEGIPQNIVDNTLRMLVENEYLLTNLRLPAYCNDSLKHVIEIVGSNEMIEDVISELKKLQKSIEIYSKSENAFMHIETIESIYCYDRFYDLLTSVQSVILE